MKHRARVLSICLVLLVAALAPALAKEIIIASGTDLTAQVMTSVNSKTAQKGDQVYVMLVPPYPNGDSSFYHAKIYGHVTRVVKAGQGREARLGFDFDKVILHDGVTAPISARVINVTENRKNNTAQIAGGALIGMLAGNYLGKLVGTNAGGAVGLATGALLAANMKSNVTVPAGSSMTLQVVRTLALNR